MDRLVAVHGHRAIGRLAGDLDRERVAIGIGVIAEDGDVDGHVLGNGGGVRGGQRCLVGPGHGDRHRGIGGLE